MTVIAYRAGIMASDSCWSTYGTQTVSAIKIIRLSSGAVLGSAGDNDARAIYALLDKIKDPQKLPSRAEFAATKIEYEGLIAFPKGGVYMVVNGHHDESGYPSEEGDCGVWQATTMGGYAACGSGGDIALAAMDAGATAKEAVIIACRRNIYCRPPVHIMKLHPNLPKKKER